MWVLGAQWFTLVFQIVVLVLTFRNIRKQHRDLAMVRKQLAATHSLIAALEQMNVLHLALWRLTWRRR
jgi:hypothetical protein